MSNKRFPSLQGNIIKLLLLQKSTHVFDCLGGASLNVFGASLNVFGASLNVFGASLNVFGASWGKPERVWGKPERANTTIIS